MARKDYLLLSDVRAPTPTIVCEPCGRRGCYRVERLIARYCDLGLPEFKTTIAACPKTQAFSIYDRCKAKFEGL